MSFLKKIKTNIEDDETKDSPIILAKSEEGRKKTKTRAKMADIDDDNDEIEEEVDEYEDEDEEYDEDEEDESEYEEEEEDDEEEEEKERKKKEKKKKNNQKKESPKKEAQDWIKSEGQLAVDVYHTPKEFCIQAPIAGVNPDDLDISIENEMVVIKGTRNEPNQEEEKNYFYQECYWGPFSRQIILPEDVDIQRIKASLKKGVLMIKIPRVKKIKKKKINVIAE